MNALDEAMSALDQAAATHCKSSSPASERVRETLDGIEALRGLIGAKKVAEAKKALQSADRDVLRARQAEFAHAVVATCARHGIRLQALPPLKRQRKAKKEPEAPQTEEPRAPETQASSSGDEPAPEAGKKSGGVFGLGRRAA